MHYVSYAVMSMNAITHPTSTSSIGHEHLVFSSEFAVELENQHRYWLYKGKAA